MVAGLRCASCAASLMSVTPIHANRAGVKSRLSVVAAGGLTLAAGRRWQPTRMITMVHGGEGRFHELCTCHRVSPSSPFISRRVYRISSELRSQAASSFLSTGVGDHPGIGGNGDSFLLHLLQLPLLLHLLSSPCNCSSVNAMDALTAVVASSCCSDHLVAWSAIDSHATRMRVCILHSSAAHPRTRCCW